MPEAKKKYETVDRDFVYETDLDPNRQIPGTSLYLDDVERINAEEVRAAFEGREPDFDNPGSAQGSPLVSVASLETGAYPQTPPDSVQRITLKVKQAKE